MKGTSADVRDNTLILLTSNQRRTSNFRPCRGAQIHTTFFVLNFFEKVNQSKNNSKYLKACISQQNSANYYYSYSLCSSSFQCTILFTLFSGDCKGLSMSEKNRLASTRWEALSKEEKKKIWGYIESLQVSWCRRVFPRGKKKLIDRHRRQLLAEVWKKR